ncbi:MAG: type VI secretion system tip protein VgrG [endosymbiont of Galathealinum brachiosum]|uniref:Type VI secretion system tip protein VgrG n=1 Tax=endosymbiont of Galathealinum brachiosum TaxID=2200906 RepID=A0A370DGA4_9GAMM|nr:MAG: type VI secretion system tip protein VgrG [endosymbiont of Galathealinum brachiosum]
MSDLTQDSRLISISSPLPKDELLLTSFEGTEYISDLFEFHIEVLSSNHSLKPDQLIGKTVDITIQNDQKRTFNGFISRFTYGEIKSDNLRVYHLTMVPWLWFLSKTNNHRIFQEMSTKDIISQIFRDLGFNDFDYKAAGSSEPREYCVQHNESDLNFISRLLEEDGVSYFFEQKNGKHVMQIVDAANAHQVCAETDLTYSKGNQPNTQLTRWEHVYEFKKGSWSLDDYDFKSPQKNQFQTTASTSKFANVAQYEHYEYTPYHNFAGLKDLTKKRIEAEEAPLNVIEASSDCSSFYAGGKFKLSKHAVKEEQGTYVITAVRHRAYDNSYLAGNESQSEYGNDLTCIPEKVHFRPPLIHLKPTMRGPQSAVVVGPSGEEIYVDELGRIKVQFHWDREGKNNETSTCYISVIQSWAGAGWGTSFIPRIGMEVIVNFIDGDPDRPIVTGSIYNGDNAPPFSSKTQSGIRTRSSKKGSSANCNELRFDDLKDSEQIYVHAEKNLDTEVENDETHSIDHDRSKTIGNDESSSIGNNRTKSVGKNQSESIGSNKTISVGEDHSEEIAKNKSLTIGESHDEAIGKDMDLTVGKNISIDAGDSIVLKTGSASITMKKDGTITIKGKNITVQGSGKINVKASSSVTIKGSKVSTN